MEAAVLHSHAVARQIVMLPLGSKNQGEEEQQERDCAHSASCADRSPYSTRSDPMFEFACARNVLPFRSSCRPSSYRPGSKLA